MISIKDVSDSRPVEQQRRSGFQVCAESNAPIESAVFDVDVSAESSGWAYVFRWW